MNKAVFFDRDGVINNEENHYYVFRKKDFVLNKGIIEALNDLQKKGYLLIVITNQGGIAKGEYSKEDVEEVHALMQQMFRKEGIHITEVYYCPHHPVREICLCRKPDTLSIEKALARFDIDPKLSWFVGDRESDMEAGQKAGLQTLKVTANQDMSVLKDLIR